DETRLRLLSDRQTYKVGEEASVRLHSRGRAGTALLAWEADRILQYKLLPLREGDNAASWEVDHAQFPHLTLTAARMAGSAVEEEESREALQANEAERDRIIEEAQAQTVAKTEPGATPAAPTDFAMTGRPSSANSSPEGATAGAGGGRALRYSVETLGDG